MGNSRIKVYLYTRVSTLMLINGYSLDAQKTKMKAFCDYNEYEIAGEYEDAGKSGKSTEGSEAFNRMMDDIRSGKDGVAFVLVFKLSRFGRNAADVLSALQVMQDYGVNLICVEEGIVSSRKMGNVIYRFGDESESSEGNGLDSSEELLRRRIIEEVSNDERINGIDTQNLERTSPLTDRELLSMAKDLISTADFTEGEMTAFNVFNKRMDKLTDLETQRTELGRLYKEQQFGSNVDRQAAAETLNRMP